MAEPGIRGSGILLAYRGLEAWDLGYLIGHHSLEPYPGANHSLEPTAGTPASGVP